MPVASNDAQVKAMLMPAIRKAAEYTADKILELNKEKIQTWVYGRYTPKSYKRTEDEGSFKEAWETKVKQSSTQVTATLDYAPDKMSTGHPYTDDGDPLITDDAPYGRGQHVSILDGSDIREYLAEIIYDGKAGEIFGEGKWTKSRNAYKQLDRTLGKGQLARFFEQGMRRAGLKFVTNSRQFTKTTRN